MTKSCVVRLKLVRKVTEDVEEECCTIEQCNRKGTNLIVLLHSDDLDWLPAYYGVCDLHYEELMSGYYRVTCS